MKRVLYHGSYDGLVGPIRSDRSRTECDFGRGFYMGTDPAQPRTLICGKPAAHPTLYTLSCDFSALRILRLEADLDWALFVAFNRGLMVRYADATFYAHYAAMRRETDLVYGKIADDRIYQSVTGFFRGEMTAECLLEAVACLNLGYQYCAVTPAACAAISIVEAHELTGAEAEGYRARARRQHETAAQRTAEIVRRHRHVDGTYFDELLERMADAGVERPEDGLLRKEGAR